MNAKHGLSWRKEKHSCHIHPMSTMRNHKLTCLSLSLVLSLTCIPCYSQNLLFSQSFLLLLLLLLYSLQCVYCHQSLALASFLLLFFFWAAKQVIYKESIQRKRGEEREKKDTAYAHLLTCHVSRLHCNLLVSTTDVFTLNTLSICHPFQKKSLCLY